VRLWTGIIQWDEPGQLAALAALSAAPARAQYTQLTASFLKATADPVAGFSGGLCDQGSGAIGAAAALTSPATTAGGIIGSFLCLVAALVLYNRWFAGHVPQLDGVAKRVDEGVVAAASAARRCGERAQQ